jgi:trans-aconitate methyltransferase
VSVQTHWDNAYSSKGVKDRSWSEIGNPDALSEIINCGIDKGSSIIDVGGGSSTIVDALVRLGYTDLSVLDISQSAIDEARERVGEAGSAVSWIIADILTWQSTKRYDYWNDRAVFHFLTTTQDQLKYVQQVLAATNSGGHIVIATFSPSGPESCSGLPVQRWSATELAALFESECEVISHNEYEHVTPWGSAQSFMRLHLRRR